MSFLLKHKILFSVLGFLFIGGIITTPILLRGTKSEERKLVDLNSESDRVSSPQSVDVSSQEVDSKSNSDVFSSEFIKEMIAEDHKIVQSRYREVGQSESSDLLEEGLREPSENEISQFQELVKLIKGQEGRMPTSESKRLTKGQRKTLMNYYSIFSKSDPTNKDKNSDEQDVVSSPPPIFKQYYYEIVLNDLVRINWDKDEISLIKNGRILQNNDWGEWAQNPFRHFYTHESSWKKNIGDTNLEENGFKIELEIALWLIKEMERIHREYTHIN